MLDPTPHLGSRQSPIINIKYVSIGESWSSPRRGNMPNVDWDYVLREEDKMYEQDQKMYEMLHFIRQLDKIPDL